MNQTHSFFQQVSIRNKLLVSILGLLILCILVLSGFSYRAMQNLSDDYATSTENEVRKSVLNTMKLTGQNAAAQVQELLNVANQVPKELTKMLEDSAFPDKPLSREQVMALTKSALTSNPKLSALYAQFEANGYDNNDNALAGSGDHTSDSGSLETYWVKEAGTYNHYASESAEKYDASLDDNGIRAAEFYLCSYDSHKACLLDPYLYEIEEGNSELMTSLIQPVMKNNRFIGVVGADINLPVVQNWLKKQASEFYGGQSQLSLISQRQLLVASTQHPDSLSQNVATAAPELKTLLDTQSSEITDPDFWHVKVALSVEGIDTQWTLIVSVPTKVALAPLAKMEQQTQASFSQLTQSFIVITIIVLAVAAILIFWLAGTLSKPIERVSGSIAQLASNEGDLTQQVDVASHQELILLADGLNRFMAKLRDMISHLKQVAGKLDEQMHHMDASANAIRHETEEQDQNLDNVVTAMNEMATSAIEVAKLASHTSQRADESGKLLVETQHSVKQNVDEVNALASSMQTTSEQVANVANRSQDITSIIGTIQAIAEQTNLLALNAAIEAARAGEQGRGFAVVADEVRSLAARTQVSTQEISGLIKNLQSDVDVAVSALGSIQQSVQATVGTTMETFERLSKAAEGMAMINDNAAQVATAAEEQSQVSEEINSRIVAIGDGSTQLASMSDELKQLSNDVKELVNGMNTQLGRLKSGD